MKGTTANKGLSLAIAILLACMALPSMAKLSHALHGHMERECSKDARLHFHTAEFDCAFQKFKNTAPLYHAPPAITIRIPKLFAVFQLSNYTFLNRFSPLHFSLRAPPLFS